MESFVVRMVICVNGIPMEEVPPDMSSLFHMHPGYRDSANLLLSVPTKVVGPVGLLYVLERELAITVPHDKNVSILGTDDATTCVMAVLRHTGSGAVGLTHILGYGFEDAVITLIQRVRELSQGFAEGRLDLSLVGCFADSRNFSESVFQAIMHPFHKHSCEVDLRLACIGEVNTTIRDGIPWPIISGIGVNVKTGEIFPATFPDRGPEQSLRRARHLTGGHQVLDIYDCGLGLHRIGPFNYEPLRGVDLWLEQSDEFIIQHLSTSPEVESSHFTGMIRQSLKYIQEHPFPAVTVFRDNRPHYYKRDEITGMWVPFRY